MTRHVGITLSGPMAEGKSVVANAIKRALQDEHVTVTLDSSVGSIPDHVPLNFTDPLEVTIREIIADGRPVTKDGSLKRAHEAQHGDS
jgi:hypothetical protein